MTETVNIHDAAEDKKYFTMIPNMVVDTLTTNELALYILMKRVAGDHGVFKMGLRSMKNRLGLGHKTISSILTRLEELHYITFQGFQAFETDTGFQKVRCYSISDIWGKNMANFQTKNEGVPDEAHLAVPSGAHLKKTAKNHRGVPTQEHPGGPSGARKKKDNSNKNSGSTLGAEAPQPKFPGSLINEIIDLFSSVNPSVGRLFMRKPQREATLRLLTKYGETKVRGMIGSLPEVLSKKGAPQITTPTQLEDKLGQLIIFYKQNNQTKEVIY